MTRNRNRRAAVLAAALHAWTTTTRSDQPTPTTTRLVVRQAPDWEHIATEPLTDDQVNQLLGLLRDHLSHPGPRTETQAEAAVDQILAEWRAEGRRTIRPADWTPVMSRIGRPRSWLSQHLVHLADARYLTETRRPGTYRL